MLLFIGKETETWRLKPVSNLTELDETNKGSHCQSWDITGPPTI